MGGVTTPSTVAALAACPYCGADEAVRAGVRKTRAGVRQLFRCNACQRRFSNDNPTASRTPPHVIRRALALVCQGYTYDEALRFIAARQRIRVSKSAISKWVSDFNPPYLAIRKMNAGHKPIVRAHLFTHRGLNYNFQVHQPKRWSAPGAGRPAETRERGQYGGTSRTAEDSVPARQVRASGTSARTDAPKPATVTRPETQNGTRQGNTP